MSAETFPLCFFSAERCCSTQSSGIRDEGHLPTQLKTQPSQPSLGRVSVAGPWKGAGSGGGWWSDRGGGGRRGGRRQRASLRGGGLRGTASPAQRSWVGAPGREGEEGSQPGEESQEQRGQSS